MIESRLTEPTKAWQNCLEALAIFALFALQGAWPVPEVNEPYYLGKAIHFWNPTWASSDVFLQSADAHKVFYFTVGWLSIWLSPDAFAWTLRVLIWAVQAAAWQRLATGICNRAGYGLLSAALMLFFWQHFNMAGEWVVGAAEAKGFAFALVFWGMGKMLRGRWTWVWPLLGAAAAFHVLVGGWAILAAGGVWLGEFARPEDAAPRPRGHWLATAISMLVGALLSMLGAVPSLLLDRGVDAATISKAHRIYVFERLGHHLDPARFISDGTLWPMLLICLLWAVLWPVASQSAAMRRLRGFTLMTITFAIVGMVIGLTVRNDKALAAGLLRFYWFRLADVVVPLSLSLTALAWFTASRFRVAWVAAIFLALFHVVDCCVLRIFAEPPVLEQTVNGEAWRSAWLFCRGQLDRPLFPRQARADRLPDAPSWIAACKWVASDGNIPLHARFIVPHGAQTFKWHSGRGEVFDWKEMPQDARALVDWWTRHKEIYVDGKPPPLGRYCETLVPRAAQRLKELARRYEADYVIALREPSHGPLPLEVVYKNDSYIIYKVR